MTSQREGRSIRYAAHYGAMEELLAYLYENCCQAGACCPPDSPLVALSGARKGKTAK